VPGSLEGLHLAAPEVQEFIRHKARRKGQRTPPSIVVEAEEFLTKEEVRRVLHRRITPGPDFRRLLATGLLIEAYRATDGEAGVTRSSVERELRWRQQSNRFQRLRREVHLLLGPLIGWWCYPLGASCDMPQRAVEVGPLRQVEPTPRRGGLDPGNGSSRAPGNTPMISRDQ
jgi:hypothetical protein